MLYASSICQYRIRHFIVSYAKRCGLLERLRINRLTRADSRKFPGVLWDSSALEISQDERPHASLAMRSVGKRNRRLDAPQAGGLLADRARRIAAAQPLEGEQQAGRKNNQD